MKINVSIIIGFMFFISCEEQQEPQLEISSNFSWQIDELNFKTVHFTNKSINASAYLWEYGNGDFTTHENPTYTFPQAGNYEITLTAIEGEFAAVKTQTISIVEIPTPPLSLINGNGSKTWKLYRVGSAASMGPDASQPELWWSGFTNDGSRSCLYRHEFTFNSDLTFQFNDDNTFWGDSQIWSETDPEYESCFVPSVDNMTVDNADLTNWLSGTHNYYLDSDNGLIVLKGKGAWMGFPFLGYSSNHGTDLPDSTAFNYSIESKSDYDLLTIHFDHGADGYWTFRYVNYDNWADEPALIE